MKSKTSYSYRGIFTAPILHRCFSPTPASWTGTFFLGHDAGVGGKPKDVYRLDPDTSYTVRMGTLTVDDPIQDDVDVQSEALHNKLPKADVWVDDLLRLDDKTSEAHFRTFSVSNRISNGLSFIVGSCRYPGLLWKIKHADRIFGPIANQVFASSNVPAPKFSLMVGDQIYADMMNRHIPIGLADTFEEFQDRYHKAFGSPNMRRLLRHLPTYMILDDHEIEDNWTQDRLESGKKAHLI